MNFWFSSARRVVLSLLLLSICLASPAALLAQANIGGSLHGTITDKTGAGIPSSTATLTSADTAVVYKGSVDARGQYVFNTVPPGKYVLVVQAPGFSEAKFSNVVIDLNQAEVLPVNLEVGVAGATVEVSTESESVVTTNTSVTGVFTAKEITSLPLNGRDYQNLLYLSPGITRAAGGEGQGSGVVSAGTRATNNNYLIDGADNNDPVVPSGAAGGAGGEIGPVPLDEVAEFTVIAANGSAEFGRSSGAVINVVTKSGTNSIHGTLFEFVRNPKFNTRQWFDKVGFKSAFKQNDFGGRFGIPLIKDKTFMAGAYEGYRQRAASSTTEYFPSIELENTITDNTFKQYLLAFLPQVSNGGIAITAAAGNYSQTGIGALSQTRNYTNDLDGDYGFVRFDQVWSSRHQSFLTGSILDGVYGGRNSGTVAYSGYGETLRPYHFVFGDNFSYTAHILNTFRLAVQRTAFQFPGEHFPTSVLSAGTARTNGPFAGQPYVDNIGSANGPPTVASALGLFSTLSTPSNFPQGRATNVSELSEAVTIERGRHEIKFGGELTYIQENGVFSNAIRPSVSILDTTLAGFDAGTLNSQSQYFYLTGSSNRGFRQLEQGYFLQDSWRATERFTVEAGIRYDLYPAFSEVHNLLGNAFLLDASGNPQFCTSLPVGTAAMSNVALLNPALYGHKAICTDYNNFAPRIGFSYDVTGKGKTVVKGGFGYFYDRIFDNIFGNSRFNAPAVAPITITSGAFDGQQATGAINTTQIYTGTVLDPHLRTPYTSHYNLTVSQEIDKATSLTIAYVGSIGQKLFATQNPNYGTSFPDAFRPTNAALGGTLVRLQSDINAGIVKPPFGNLSLRTSNAASNFDSMEVTVKRRTQHGISGQLAYTWAHSMDNISDEISGGTDSASPQSTLDNYLAPYLAPGSPCPVDNTGATAGSVTAASLIASTITSATSYLHAVQCAQGNTALTAATAPNVFIANYSKFRPIGANYGDSGFDVRNRVAVNVLYSLPFGNGKMFGHDAHGFVDELIGGWNLTSTIDFQTGTPYLINSGVDSNRDGTVNDRAKLVSDGPRNPQLIKNSTLFALPNVSRFQCATTAPSTTTLNKTCADGGSSITFNEAIGNIDPRLLIHRGAFREPGIFDWDAEIFKNFRLEKLGNLRFSADGFNVLNRANFSTLGATLTSSSFSRASTTRAINNTVSRQFQFALKYEF